MANLNEATSFNSPCLNKWRVDVEFSATGENFGDFYNIRNFFVKAVKFDSCFSFPV